MTPVRPPIFEALIVPHRSLTPRGVRKLVAVVLILTAAISARFWLLGAWPVLLISFVEVPLLGVLLTINQHRAKASELIMLNSRELTVVRTDPAGRRQHQSLPAAWLRVDLDSTKGNTRIVLSTHGHRCEIGAFLHEPEKVSLFGALEDALYRARNPVFDNAQLGEGR